MRGNLEEIKKNFSNTERHLNGTKNTHITKQPLIQPKKDIIQLIETENAKSKAEANEFLEKFKAVTSNKNAENDQITKKAALIEKDNRECIIEEEDEEEKRTIPPKPLPRKSISEQSSTEEFPKPRPRVTGGNNYKVSSFTAHMLLFELLVVDFIFICTCSIFIILSSCTFRDDLIMLFILGFTRKSFHAWYTNLMSNLCVDFFC